MKYVEEAGLLESIHALENGLDTVIGERGLKLLVGQKVNKIFLSNKFIWGNARETREIQKDNKNNEKNIKNTWQVSEKLV